MSKTQLKTDWVCIATAGATVDGRNISSQDLYDMAETYNPETYTALIWWEHYRFFSNLGQVLSLKAEEIDGKTKLFAELRPTAELVSLNQAGQKVFTSIEISPNFLSSGKAYLGGLAVTDSPASIGTTQLNFSARGISQTDLIIGNKEEFNFTMQEGEDKDSFFTALLEVFKKFTGESGKQQPHIEPTISHNHNHNEENQPMDNEQFNKLLDAINSKIDEKFNQQAETTPEPEKVKKVEAVETAETAETVSKEEFNALEQKFTALQEKFNTLSKTEVTEIPQGKGANDNSKFKMAV